MTNERKNIVWIASYPKSGNTWFRLFLNSILNHEEGVIDINNTSNISPIASSRIIFDNIVGINSSDLNPEEIIELRPLVYQKLSSEQEQTIYIKTHDAWQKNESGKELFPKKITKGVIYIVRNPFDLAVSFANHLGVSISTSIKLINNNDTYLAGNMNKLSSQLSQHIGSWSEHFNSWIDNSGLNFFIMRYEDMLKQSVEVFGNALDFLSIKCHLNQIKLAIKNTSFNELQKQEISSGFKEKPIQANLFFNKGRMSYWREYLDDHSIKLIIENHFNTLKRLDYFNLLNIDYNQYI